MGSQHRAVKSQRKPERTEAKHEQTAADLQADAGITPPKAMHRVRAAAPSVMPSLGHWRLLGVGGESPATFGHLSAPPGEARPTALPWTSKGAEPGHLPVRPLMTVVVTVNDMELFSHTHSHFLLIAVPGTMLGEAPEDGRGNKEAMGYLPGEGAAGENRGHSQPTPTPWAGASIIACCSWWPGHTRPELLAGLLPALTLGPDPPYSPSHHLSFLSSLSLSLSDLQTPNAKMSI